MDAKRTLRRTAGLALLAALAVLPMLAEARQRHQDHRQERHLRDDRGRHGRHWQREHRYGHQVPPWFRSPGLRYRHDRDWRRGPDRRHRRDDGWRYRRWHHDGPRHRYLADPSGLFLFRLF